MRAKRAEPDYPRVEVRTRDEWRGWLEENHAIQPGVWLVTFKKDSGEPHLTYDEVVEESLAFGWVDSLPRKLDEKRTMLLVTPRRANSSWSKANKERVERLIMAGRMAEAGVAKVEAAKRSGAWTRLDEVEALVVPADLGAALSENAQARQYFDEFPPSSRRGILEWVLNAKQTETRARRIEETVRLASDNIRANHYRQSKNNR